MIWLAAAGVALVLGLTWLFLRAGDDAAAPSGATPYRPVSSASSPEAGSDGQPAEGVIDFAPVPEQPGGGGEAAGPEQAAGPAPETDTHQLSAGFLQPTAPEQAGTPADAPAAPAPVTKPPKPSPKPADKKPAPPKPSAKPADKPAPAPEPAQSAEPPAQTAGEEMVEPLASGDDKYGPGLPEISDKWVVNISSTPDASESLRLLSALMGQDVGGRVYASEVTIDGRLQHRIRVGFFGTREEAEAVGLKIKELYQLYATPWAVRPTKEEELKFGSGL
jgi:DedD protein